MNKNREVVILHELSISVALDDGAEGMDVKYAVYKTGKNFIRIQYNDPNAETYSFKNGYANLMSRVPVDELMLVRIPSWHDDTTDCVRRKIYCLEKDSKDALNLLIDAVNKQIETMKKEMDVLHGLWVNRKK